MVARGESRYSRRVTSHRSLWEATAPAGPTALELVGSLRAEVIIVGAGYTGLSAALHLSEAGRDVIVIEASEIGAGGSGLNGGQVIPGVKHDPDMLEQIFGPAAGQRYIETVATGPDLVFELIGKHAIACDAVRTGWIQPASSEAALELLAGRAEQWRSRGASVDLLSRAETVRLLGSERYWGAWIDRRGGNVQPLAYARGLARAALAAGARIFCRTPALELVREGAQWRIRTPNGNLSGAQVILATGAYSGALSDRLRRSLVVVPSLQVATQVVPEALRQTILPERQAASDTCHLLRYFRMDAGGRFIMGTRGMFGDVPLAQAARHHYAAVREIYPQLAGLSFEYHWGGLVALTADHLPHLHELGPGLLAGLGFNGRGVAMATMMGRLLARRALGCPHDELNFPVTPLRPIAFHGFSHVGARAAMQVLRLRDRLGRSDPPRLRAQGTA
jgi:glycine/D-amino acid oxidase-like deaminating enzyme